MVAPTITCWVIDHPAHAQALLPFIRQGSTDDLIIATRRPDVEHLLATGEGVLPRRETLWVERPVGPEVGKIARLLLARRRITLVRQALKSRRASDREIDQIVVIAAPLELRAAKRSGIPRRLYISDNEGDHISHRLALGVSTEILLPDSWRGEMDGGFLAKANSKGMRIHRFGGNKAHVYLRPATLVESRPDGGGDGKRIMVRRLLGGGIHDGEIVDMVDVGKLDLDYEIDEHIEGERLPEPWSLPNRTLDYTGVLTQSVTLATESASLGVPAMLISSAGRGVFTELLASGALTICDNIESQGAEISAWLADLHQSDCGEWPDTLAEWQSIILPPESATVG